MQNSISYDWINNVPVELGAEGKILVTATLQNTAISLTSRTINPNTSRQKARYRRLHTAKKTAT